MPAPPVEPPSSGGIHLGDVGGSVNFSALGDIVGGDKITTITTTIQISIEAITQRPLITTSPYRGLDRFEDRDKDLFFGRDQLIKSLLAQLSASNVLLVLGASGSGKSSVVRAGLLPQLSQLIGARFRYFTFVPDVNPFDSLRSALQAAEFSQAQTRELGDARPEIATKLIHTLQRNSDQWLFFVDQFEEIFTVADEKLRASFIAALVAIAQDPNSSTKLVLAMRADFLDRFSPFPQFAKIIEKNIDFVADMHVDELRLAIEQPAARHGVVFEQGLVEEIIKDVQGQAGSLPLLQYTLDLLWQEEAREDGLADRHLNTRAYRQLGGVRGALQKRADEIYASFGDGTDVKAASPKQGIVRQIFLRLVDLAGEGANDAAWRPVRRRASMAMFTAAQEQEILQALINQKLLVSNREGDDATVEVAHEALFTSWGRLKNWIEVGKQVIFARNRLADDARRWQRRQQAADTGADEELLSGSRLSQALEMRARGDFVTVVGGLGETETQFLDASAALRDRRRQEEQERQQRELAQAQVLAAERARSNSNLRLGIGMALALTVIALVVAGFAWNYRNNALNNAAQAAANQHVAEEQAAIAQSGRLAALASSQLENKRLPTALLLAVEGVHRWPTYEARSVLANAVENQPRLMKVLQGHQYPITHVKFSLDNKTVFSAGEDGVICWDVSTGQPQYRLSERIPNPDYLFSETGTEVVGHPFGKIFVWHINEKARVEVEDLKDHAPIALTRDGRLLAAVDSTEQTVVVWNLAEGRISRSYKIPVKRLARGTFSPDENTVALTIDDGDKSVVLLDVHTGDLKYLSPLNSAARGGGWLVFSPDGKTLVRYDFWTVSIWRLNGENPEAIMPPELQGQNIFSAQFSPNGQSIAFAGFHSMILWDLAQNKGQTLAEDQKTFFGCVAFSPNGEWLAFGSDDGSVTLQTIRGGQRKILLNGHSNKVRGLAFSPDGTTLASGSEDHDLILWDVAGIGGEPMAGRRQAVLSKTHPGWIHGVALSSDGKMMASLGEDGMALWDLQTGAREPVFRSDAAKGMGGVVFSPNGKLLATAGQGIVSIWDVADRRLVFSSPKPTPDQALIEANSVTALAFSSDSQTLATGKEEVLLLAAATGREIKRLPAAKSRGRTERLAFSGDGKHLLICQIGLDDELATVLDWNLNDGIVDLKKTPNQTEGDIKAMDGIHAGKVIPMLDVIGRLFLWDLATGDVSDLSEVGPHSFEQLNMALSADGSLVALADKQGSVSLWDTSARRPIGPDRPHPNHAYATAIAFSADQSTLAVGDADGTIVLWHGPKKWEADAAIIANRNLSIEEWKEFMGVGIPYRRTFIDFPPN